MKKRRSRIAGKKVWARGSRFYTDPQYEVWRKAVRERDNYTCQKCGFKPTKGARIALVCHHIRRWADQPTLRFVVSNGILLCRKCHAVVTGNEDAYAPYLMRIVIRNNKND